MGILDMKVVSHQGNRYLLVVVDRATKFLFGLPLPTKETLGISRKLLVRADPHLRHALADTLRPGEGARFGDHGASVPLAESVSRLRPGQPPQGTRDGGQRYQM